MNYTILQPINPTFKVLDGQQFKKVDYKFVYDGTIEDGETISVLERLFEKFNIAHPEDFKGHSLSVGDIVVLDGVAYVCNSFGWDKVEWTLGG